MAYNSDAHITIGQLKTALTRVKTEYVAADDALVVDSTSVEVATDDEVSEMLEEVFAAEETTDTTEDDTTGTTE